MALLRVAVAVALLGLWPTLASADIAAPRGKEPQAPVERRTGRVPATITVSPAGAGTAPTHLIITVPREVLRDVMSGPLTAGRLDQAADDPPASAPVPSASRLRHIVGAIALALALASLPFAFRGRRPFVAVLIALLCGAGAVGVVRGELLNGSAAAGPSAGLAGPERSRGGEPALPSAPDAVGLAQVGGGTPRTVEFVIVPGRGPVRVEARYVR